MQYHFFSRPLDNARVMLHRNLISSFLLSDILKILLWTKYNKIDYTVGFWFLMLVSLFYQFRTISETKWGPFSA